MVQNEVLGRLTNNRYDLLDFPTQKGDHEVKYDSAVFLVRVRKSRISR